MSRKSLYHEIEAELHAGRPVAQATVIETKGSTPRKAGSAMLVKQNGKLFGTIGGGCGEAGVIQKARLSLHDGKLREELADLTEDIAVESEGVCGGIFRVFIEPWQPTPEHLALIGQLNTLAESDEEVIIHHVVKADEGYLGTRMLQTAEGTTIWPEASSLPNLSPPPERKPLQLSKQHGYEIYTERWSPVPTLVIVGAGHIAEPLEVMARMTGFRTTVIDDRALFANRERFPKASKVICRPILEAVGEIPLTPHTYLVLVTRGHALDMDALKVVVDRDEPLAYLGMIGSSRRIKAVFQLMAELGYPRSLFEQVHAPVGLNIGAETPAEIAVAIVAEMISVLRNNGQDTRPLVKISAVHPSLRSA